MADALHPFDRPIALVGMPGAGKTSVGRLLAERLGLGFRDSDEEVVREAGLSVERLFFSEGEAAFRDRERRELMRLIGEAPCVISTGGGAMVQRETRSLLLSRTVTIWLQASPETLLRRLAAAPPRPLLNGDDRLATLRSLQERRRPSYAEARIHIGTDGLALPAIAEVVERALTAWASGR